jgi:hypothetical protein
MPALIVIGLVVVNFLNAGFIPVDSPWVIMNTFQYFSMVLLRLAHLSINC